MLFEFIFGQLMEEARQADAHVSIDMAPDCVYTIEVYTRNGTGAILARKNGLHLCAADLDNVRLQLQATLQHLRDW